MKNKQIAQREKTIKLNCTIRTGGDGLWSNAQRDVKVTKMVLHQYAGDDGEFDKYYGADVFFLKSSWDVDKHGLIYTDRKFINELKLKTGIKNIEYTEQGMQGWNFVSCEFESKKDLFKD